MLINESNDIMERASRGRKKKGAGTALFSVEAWKRCGQGPRDSWPVTRDPCGRRPRESVGAWKRISVRGKRGDAASPVPRAL